MRRMAPVALSAILGAGCAEREDAIAVALSTPSVALEAAACAVFVSGTDLDPCAATYLGGPGADEANAVDVGADGSIIIGGSIAANDFGLSPALLGGTDVETGPSLGAPGAVVRLDASAHAITTISRIQGS